MTHYIDVPVTYDEIQIGDYITGEYNGRFRNTLSGYVSRMDRVYSCLHVTKDDGRDSGNMADDVRTWTRRVLATDPEFILTDPKVLGVGDNIRAYRPDGTLVSRGPVSSPSFFATWVQDLAGRQVYRRLTTFIPPEAWANLGQVNEAQAPDLSSRYPTLHHLKAAIFNVVRDNYTKGEWCSDVELFLQKFNIISSLDQEDRDRAHGEVRELIAKLQGNEPTFQGASSSSLDAAFQRLGIPRTPPPPPTTRFQVEIDVEQGLTASDIRDMLQGSGRITEVGHVSEVTR